jgi:magnesium-transporting ATPase (P-type)
MCVLCPLSSFHSADDILQLRLCQTSSLEISEQLLTGESVPVNKNTDTFGEDEVDIPIGDRLNLCYASTIVTKGRGVGIVVGTGMNTQVRMLFKFARYNVLTSSRLE